MTAMRVGLWTVVWLVVCAPLATAADLPGEAVFAAGKGGYNTYRIPALIVTKKGTVLAFCEARASRSDRGRIDTVLRRSTDGGKTWGPLQVVWTDGENTCGNPCPVIDRASGTILLLSTWNLATDSEGAIIAGKSKDTRRPFVCRSTDEGKTWSTPVDISAACRLKQWGWYATGPGVGIQLTRGKHKGRLVIPANHSDRGYKDHSYGSHVLLSDDAGKTWRRSGVIRPGCNESQVAELSDGSLMMNMRSYAPHGLRSISVSTDGGATWPRATQDKALIESTCQASFLRYSFASPGRKSVLLFSNPATKRGRHHMTVRASFDEGRTWPAAKLITPAPSAYSCLTVLPDGKIGLLYEAGQRNAYEGVYFTRFALDSLKAVPK